jgi:hypothetical protein
MPRQFYTAAVTLNPPCSRALSSFMSRPPAGPLLNHSFLMVKTTSWATSLTLRPFAAEDLLSPSPLADLTCLDHSAVAALTNLDNLEGLTIPDIEKEFAERRTVSHTWAGTLSIFTILGLAVAILCLLKFCNFQICRHLPQVNFVAAGAQQDPQVHLNIPESA